MDFTLVIKHKGTGIYGVLYDEEGKMLKDYFEHSAFEVVKDVVLRNTKWPVIASGNRLIIHSLDVDESLDFSA